MGITNILPPQGSHSDWKTWKNGKAFPVREKSGNIEQTGKVGENQTKYWKTEEILVTSQ